MLEFCDAPYQFFAPQPSKPVMAVCRPLNRLLLRYDLGVREQEISGEIEQVKDLIKSGARVLFAPNHPTRTDPQFVGEVQRQLGTHPSFMAAYDVFLESRVQRWLMQKTGCFSIDREGNDRKSMSTAIDILKKGDMALTIFPEGNVYHLNDRVTPIQDGPAFIAAKAQQSIKDEGEVWIVPISLKYSCLTDIRKNAWRSLHQIAADSKYQGKLDRDDPVSGVLALGGHLISRFLQSKTDFCPKVNLAGNSPGETKEEISKLTLRMTGELEKELEMEAAPETHILDRVRKIRSKIHQFRSNETGGECLHREKYTGLADRAIFTFRLLTYMIPYLGEKPTIDRFAETVSRIREDHYSRSCRPFGPRKAMARIGEPISIRAMLAESGGKAKDMIPGVTGRIEASIQNGIDKLNLENNEIGSQSILDR